MAGSWGANPAELDALAASMTRAGEQLASMTMQAHNALHADIWRGPDAQRARHEWDSGLRPQLRGVVSALTQCAETLRQQATQQREASAAVVSVSPAGTGGAATGSAPSMPGSPALPWRELSASWGLLGVAEGIAGGMDMADLGPGLAFLNNPAFARLQLFTSSVAFGYDLGEFMNADNGHDRVTSGIGAVASGLGVIPHPVAQLTGIGIDTGLVIYEELAVADFSPQGIQMVVDEIQENPMVLFEEVGKATIDVFSRVL